MCVCALVFLVPARRSHRPSPALRLVACRKYASEPYKETNGYLKGQPPSRRRRAFGSHDASRRDEFLTHIRCEQYRQQLKQEARITNKHLRRRSVADGAGGAAAAAAAAAASMEAAKPRPSSAAPTRRVTMYDRVHTTERNRRLSKTGPRNLGNLTLASRAVGLEAWAVQRPEYGARSKTKDFYFHGHVSDLL